jgi:sugar (pentulose or hexulose) kinase
MAADSRPFTSLINSADMRFYHPASMTREIADYCKETGQPVPDSPGAFVRCCLESLALDYRATAEQLAEIQSVPIKRIHIVGGGVQTKLLCQFTADATRLPVMAGPVEATALGNLLVQARAMGDVGSLDDARALVRNGTAPDCYEPQDTAAWEDAYERFMKWK